MADADLPDGSMRPLRRAFRDGQAGGDGWQAREIARRLSMLEEQVEAAIASTGVVSPPEARRQMSLAVDNVLATYVRLRRWLYEAGAPGMLPGSLAHLGLLALYRYWWRGDARGLERIPATGRVLLVANRAGMLVPFDALMLPVALALDHPAGRRAHVLIDESLTNLPVLGPVLGHVGALPASPSMLRGLLGRDEAVIAFPAAAMPFDRRYRIGRFEHPAFVRIAIETGTPIVPVAVVGSEETQPVLLRVDALRAVGLPSLPVTLTFPWLGLWGLVPLPTKWTVHVGDTLEVARDYPPAAARNPSAVRRLRDQVQERLQEIVSEGLGRRRTLFRG